MYHPFISQIKAAVSPALLTGGARLLKGMASPFAKAWGALSKAKPTPVPPSAGNPWVTASRPPPAPPRPNLLQRTGSFLENNTGKLLGGSLVAGIGQYGAGAVNESIAAKRNYHGLHDALQAKLDGMAEGGAGMLHHFSQMPWYQRMGLAAAPDAVINSEGVRSKILQAIQGNPNKDVQNYGPAVFGKALDAYGRLREGESLQGMPQAPAYLQAWLQGQQQQMSAQEARLRDYLQRIDAAGRTGIHAGGAPAPLTPLT